MAPRRPAAPGARAGRALRLQPDHRPPRARRPRPRAPPRADPRPRHVRHPPADRPRPRRLDVVHRGGPAPGPRPGDPRRHRAHGRRGRRRRRGPRHRRSARPVVHLERLRMADGEPLLLEQVFLPEARFPGLLAGDLERGSLYELLGERYDTRVVRARESLEPIALPAARGPAAGRRAAPAGAAHRGPRLRPVGPAGRVRALLRPGRPDALLRGAGRRPLQPQIRRHRRRRRRRRASPGRYAEPPRELRRRSAAPSPRGGADASDPSHRRRRRAGAGRRRVRRQDADGRAPSRAASAAAVGRAASAAGRAVRRRVGPGEHPDRDRRLDAGARPDRDPLVLLPRRRRRAGAGRRREEGRRGVQRQPPEHPR